MKLLNYLNKSENNVAIILTLVLLSMSYPYGFPLFSFVVLFFVVLKFISGNLKIRINIGFSLFFLCVLAYILGVFLNGGKIYSYNKSDLTNIIAFFLVWLLLSDLTRDKFPKLIHQFAKYSVFVCSAVAIISLYKFYKLTNGVYIEAFFNDGVYRQGTSLVKDYNMFSLALLSGLVMSIYLISKSKKVSHSLYSFASFALIFTSVIFAGSRRAWVLAILMVLVMVFLIIKYIFTHRFEKNVKQLLKYGLIISVVSLFVFLFTVLFDVDLIQNTGQFESLKKRFDTLQLEQVDDSFSSRTNRWDYAIELYSDYNPLQLFVGSGFSYLPKFGSAFQRGAESYPHNPFLSSLLYSGLVGVLIFVVTLTWSIAVAIRNRKIISLHFTFIYLISWMFLFISSNSFFSNPLLILLMMTLLAPPSKQVKINTVTTI